ncbi:MAG: ATP-binding protein [bacterium]|nr:ATP-binding protein [bacterium]
MLIAFSVGNYLSFKDIKTFNMTAASIKEKQEHIFVVNKNIKLLKSAVVYGANASGKSNLISAMNFMRNLVINSSKETQSGEKIGVTSFKFSTETKKEPSFFEIVFFYSGNKYRYGFLVDTERIQEEWLYVIKVGKNKEIELFYRQNSQINVNKTEFKEGQDKEPRENALFLSQLAQGLSKISADNKISKEIVGNFFVNKLNIVSGLQTKSFMSYTMENFANGKFKDQILKSIKEADLGIEDIIIEEVALTLEKINKIDKNLPKQVKEKILSEARKMTSITTLHKEYDKDNKETGLSSLEIEEESEGTQRYLSLLGPIIDVLNNGKILVVDEFGASLHSSLSKGIIGLFHDKEINQNNAQLIFNSHDTNLLDKQSFRRDEIWFTEKDQYGATDLYSLVEFKTGKNQRIRNDESYGKNYIAGKYGAIPFIGDFESLMED